MNMLGGSAVLLFLFLVAVVERTTAKMIMMTVWSGNR